MTETFDYIIVGGGSAGCVIAARLSGDPQSRVCLVEQGPRDKSLLLHVPIGFYKAIQDSRYTQHFKTIGEPSTGNRRMVWPRGRVLGGSSSINGLLYVRGQAEDFDEWEALGAPGWSFREVLPYFRRSESNVLGDGPFHGADGPLGVVEAPHDPLSDLFVQSAVKAGVPHNRDFNGATQEGAGYYQVTVKNGWRASTAASFLKPLKNRPNLAVRTGRAVKRILFSGKRAVGVELSDGSKIACEKEVILSAGAIGSPHLLLLSGVGPAAQLSAKGIDVVSPLEGVGRNMQDHFNSYLAYDCDEKLSLNYQSRRLAWQVKVGMEYAFKRSGQLTAGAARAGAFIKTSADLQRPDVQLHVLPFGMTPAGAMGDDPQYTITVCQLRPYSRGTVSLASADWRDTPELRPGFLTDERDISTLVAGIRSTQTIASTSPLGDVTHGARVDPAMPDSELIALVRQTGRTVFHLCGTCKMGSDDDAVVDPLLRVRGVEGLRVADASIMPTMVSGNTNAATIMIGEKASELLLGNRFSLAA